MPVPSSLCSARALVANCVWTQCETYTIHFFSFLKPPSRALRFAVKLEGSEDTMATQLRAASPGSPISGDMDGGAHALGLKEEIEDGPELTKVRERYRAHARTCASHFICTERVLAIYTLILLLARCQTETTYKCNRLSHNRLQYTPQHNRLQHTCNTPATHLQHTCNTQGTRVCHFDRVGAGVSL